MNLFKPVTNSFMDIKEYRNVGISWKRRSEVELQIHCGPFFLTLMLPCFLCFNRYSFSIMCTKIDKFTIVLHLYSICHVLPTHLTSLFLLEASIPLLQSYLKSLVHLDM